MDGSRERRIASVEKTLFQPRKIRRPAYNNDKKGKQVHEKTSSPLLEELQSTYALKEKDIKNIRKNVPFFEVETSLFVYLATTKRITFDDYQNFVEQFQKKNPYLPPL